MSVFGSQEKLLSAHIPSSFQVGAICVITLAKSSTLHPILVNLCEFQMVIKEKINRCLRNRSKFGEQKRFFIRSVFGSVLAFI
jgi:hypothetical protein